MFVRCECEPWKGRRATQGVSPVTLCHNLGTLIVIVIVIVIIMTLVITIIIIIVIVIVIIMTLVIIIVILSSSPGTYLDGLGRQRPSCEREALDLQPTGKC